MEIVQIIIFIIAVSFAVVIEMKKQARKNEVSDSIEPDVQISDDTPQKEWIYADKKENPSNTYTQKVEEKSTPQQKTKKIAVRLKSKSDARKAFIYSEIFQRKY